MPRSRIIVSVVGVLLAMSLAALDQTIVATALPRVVADLGGFGQFAWVFTAYMLASTTSIPIMGKLSDIYGRKWALAGGIVIFLVGSILCGISQDMLQLILFRGVQGLGAGAIIAISYAVVGDVFPPAQRGKWTGVVGAVMALAVISGPLVGGLVTDHLTWRWIFFINVPTGLLTLAVILGGMADVRDPHVSNRIDYRGLISLIACVVPLLLALTWAGTVYPWVSIQVIGLLVFSGVMAVIFLWAEGRAWEPLIPRELFTNSIFTIAVLVTFLTAIGMYAAIMLIPLFVQGVTGASATDAGFTLMPAMLSGVIGAIIAGQLISRTGRYKALAIAGAFLMALGAFLFTRLDAESTRTDAIWFMVIAAAGLGCVAAHIHDICAERLPSQRAGGGYRLGAVLPQRRRCSRHGCVGLLPGHQTGRLAVYLRAAGGRRGTILRGCGHGERPPGNSGPGDNGPNPGPGRPGRGRRPCPGNSRGRATGRASERHA